MRPMATFTAPAPAGARLIIYSGIPGSGKTTAAELMLKELREQGIQALRVNRDELRSLLFGEPYHYGDFPESCEQDVTVLQRKLIHHGLSRGWTVICDDTNLVANSVKSLKKLAAQYEAEVSEIPVLVELELALERNRLRAEAGGRRVPDKIIEAMFERQQNSLRSKGLI